MSEREKIVKTLYGIRERCSHRRIDEESVLTGRPGLLGTPKHDILRVYKQLSKHVLEHSINFLNVLLEGSFKKCISDAELFSSSSIIIDFQHLGDK